MTSDLDDWKTCDGCPSRAVDRQDLVLHADRWDSIKRSAPDGSLKYELEHAEHKGSWVVIDYVDYLCEFDNKPCIPDGIYHHCPHHGKVLKQKDNWWE